LNVRLWCGRGNLDRSFLLLTTKELKRFGFRGRLGHFRLWSRRQYLDRSFLFFATKELERFGFRLCDFYDRLWLWFDSGFFRVIGFLLAKKRHGSGGTAASR
jgi:hypothetical protein